MDITSGLKIGFMGGAGYIFGRCAKVNPKLTALIWVIAESANQILLYLNRDSNSTRLNVLFTVVAIGAVAYMTYVGLISNLGLQILTGIVFCFASGLAAGLFDALNGKSQARFQLVR